MGYHRIRSLGDPFSPIALIITMEKIPLSKLVHHQARIDQTWLRTRADVGLEAYFDGYDQPLSPLVTKHGRQLIIIPIRSVDTLAITTAAAILTRKVAFGVNHPVQPASQPGFLWGFPCI
jgi:hypothetical protein